MLLALHDITVGWLFMRFVDHYFLLHASERKILKQLGVNPKKTTVVGNAVQDEFFSEVTSSRDSFLQTFSLRQNYERIVLAVGRLNEVKGFQNLQYAVENLPDTLFIVIGGDDGYAEKLKQIYADYDNIIFSETFLPREQLREYYRHADIFVLPSIHEPFGIVLLEAMAQHTAIIASNNGGPVGILNPEGDENIARNASNYGVLVNPNNQELWYERIKLFVEDENLLRLYKNKAYKRVREFKWKNVLPKYLKVYNTLYT
jgi:glycosyltransferase involved in cell wall biosynthesis